MTTKPAQDHLNPGDTVSGSMSHFVKGPLGNTHLSYKAEVMVMDGEAGPDARARLMRELRAGLTDITLEYIIYTKENAA